MLNYSCNNQHCLCHGRVNTNIHFQHIYNGKKRCVFSELTPSFKDKNGCSLPAENILRSQCKEGLNLLIYSLIDSRKTDFYTPISINIEPTQLDDVEFIKDVSENLEIGDVIEINKTSILDLNENQAKSLKIILNSGLKLAVDNFGEGNCNFKLFKAFPIDFIKISRKEINFQGVSVQNTMTTARFLSNYASCIIAKDIDSERDFLSLNLAGFDLYQGEYFHQVEKLRRVLPNIRA